METEIILQVEIGDIKEYVADWRLRIRILNNFERDEMQKINVGLDKE